MKKDVILKYALQNAVHFKGKANPGAVIGKLISEEPKLRSKIKEIEKEVNITIKKINSLSVEKQLGQLKQIAPELLEEKKKQEKKGLKELSNAKKGKVVMRFEPSPSGPMHLGHAYALSLNSEYCRMYDGKLILRIADTNPENIYKPAYKLLPEDGQWVTKNNISKVILQSDRLGYYYDYAEKLVNLGKAYVCTCDSDTFRTKAFDKEECPCRNLSKEKQQTRFANMFSSYKPGEAVLRLKTDMNHKNPAMRDFPLMRINENAHPKTGTKNKVWPLMNLAVFVDDVELGITHIIRAKDHIDNARRQEYLYKYLNKPIPKTIFVGKINFQGLPMSCSKVKVLIEENKYSDWDDIRLPFLAALKRRGYQPEAFIKYAVDVGVTENDKKVSKDEFFKSLNHFNKEVIESKSNRYFFVKDPVKIKIADCPEQNVKLKLHPDDSKRGHREFKTKSEFYVSKEDYKQFKNNKIYRLMDCLNFVKKGSKFIFDSFDYAEYKKKGAAIIHWLPVQKDLVETAVLMPDGKTAKGLSEPLVNKLKQGDIIQFERTGFCRLDKKNKNKLEFWFAHR